MVRRAADRPISIAGLPGGFEAYPVDDHRDGSDGAALVRTRRGRMKLDEVELRAAGSTTGWSAPDDDSFVLGAHRRTWRTVENRYRGEAWEHALALVASGHVVIRCEVAPGPAIGAPICWMLTDATAREASRRRERRARSSDLWLQRAVEVADQLDDIDPTFASMVRECARRTAGSLPVVVCAAEDRVGGLAHDGPRAFLQFHFGDTKARRDVVTVLRDAGVPDDALEQLGLRRSARVGIAGPIHAHAGDTSVDISALDGPVLLRADQHDLHLRLTRRVPLIIVENLQAAEALADRYEAAVVYTAGMPGASVLRQLRELAQSATEIYLCTDADPGGVRIAERILDAIPAALLLDAGEVPHPASRPWREEGQAIAILEGALEGPATDLARACLARGYPVEQEATIIATVARHLSAQTK